VAIYMPMVPELAIVMLACTRIGAIHSIIFGGFSADAIRDRVNDSDCKMLITVQRLAARGQAHPAQNIADEASKSARPSKTCIVVKRQRRAVQR
jgi:acetyl-CoA synthetase